MRPIWKGYPVGADEYVVVTDEELQRFDEENTRGIEIINFVDAGEVDPIYFESPYYLERADVGHKPYKLLRLALEQSGRAALARVVMRRRASLALVRIYEKGLVLNMLHWPEEIRSINDLYELSADPDVSEKELNMALMLVESLTVPFDPSAYPDEYTRGLKALIEGKAEKREADGDAGVVSPTRHVVDIMEALMESIEATNRPPRPERQEQKKGA